MPNKLLIDFLKHGRKRLEHEEKMKNSVGRPKKHNQTKTKTMRLPTDLITELENQRKEGESFTDVLIRFVKLGMIG